MKKARFSTYLIMMLAGAFWLAGVSQTASPASISGTIRYEGERVPTMKPIDMSKEEKCNTYYSEHPVGEKIMVGKDKTFENVFVRVVGGLPDREYPVPGEPVILNQEGCRFRPHVIGIQAKQPLKIVNSDEGVLHNIHAISKEGNRFNFGMPKPMETVKKFKKPEVMVKIKCDVHGWMRSYAGVLDHPYFAVTGEDGSFNLSPLPPGEYVIEAWHEEYGTQTLTVTVAQQQTSDITFTYQAE